MMICLLHLQYCPGYINNVDKFSGPPLAAPSALFLTALNYYNISKKLYDLPFETVAPHPTLAPFMLYFEVNKMTMSLLKDTPKPLRVFF